MSYSDQYQFSEPPVGPQYYQEPYPFPYYQAPPMPQRVPHHHHHYDSRPPCPYGEECYRKNPEHFAKYRHPPGVMERNQQAPSPPRARGYPSHPPSPSPPRARVRPEPAPAPAPAPAPPPPEPAPAPARVHQPSQHEPTIGETIGEAIDYAYKVYKIISIFF